MPKHTIQQKSLVTKIQITLKGMLLFHIHQFSSDQAMVLVQQGYKQTALTLFYIIAKNKKHLRKMELQLHRFDVLIFAIIEYICKFIKILMTCNFVI